MAKYTQTSMSLSEEDQAIRERLEKNRITLIETWRRGAREMTKELDRQKKD